MRRTPQVSSELPRDEEVMPDACQGTTRNTGYPNPLPSKAPTPIRFTGSNSDIRLQDLIRVRPMR